MEVQALYDLIESHLENGIIRESKDGMKRVRLPIPIEYGGGYATGGTVEDAVHNLIKRLGIQKKEPAPLFSDFIDEWITIKEGEGRSPSTIAVYRMLIRTKIVPFFRGKRMNEINADDIQAFYNSIMHLSRSTSIQCKAILKGVFERADRRGYLEKNPMQYTYSKSKKTGNKVVLQDDDLAKVIGELYLLEETGDLRDYLYACFLCFTSLRRGEILGLKWSDICFERSEINVHTNVSFPNGQNDPFIGCPKDGSYGVIFLNDGLVERIKPYVGDPESYILPYSLEETDRPITRSMFTKMWRRISSRLDLKGATSHSFRSSYASMVVAHCDSDPKTLQELMRHKTPDLAMQVYAKRNQNKIRTTENAYNDYISTLVTDGG